MNIKLLALKELFQKKSFEPDSISDHDIDILLALAPKKVDDHYVVTNNSYEILNLLIRLDTTTQCGMPRITNYLLDFFSKILKMKVNNQIYCTKATGRIEIIEFEIISKINSHISFILELAFDKKHYLFHQIRHIIQETFLPLFTSLASKISTTNDPLEKNFEKNEVLWLRSILSMPIKKTLTRLFITENTIAIVKQELKKMIDTTVSQQLHDGFYKTGVILWLLNDLELNNVQHLIFISNYCDALLKKYLKAGEVNQKLLNPFRLSLEISLTFEERLSGLSPEGLKVLSLRKILSGLFADLRVAFPKFTVKFVNDILFAIEAVFHRIPSPRDKVKIVDILFSFYAEFKSVTHNVVQLIHEHKSITNTDSVKPQSIDKIDDPAVTNAVYAKISRIILDFILKLLETDHFDSELETADYSQNLSYNFVVNVFNSVSNTITSGSQDQPRLTVISNEEKNMHKVKGIKKYQIYGLKLLYKLAKRYKNTKLIFNLISSKFSLKNSLNNLRQIVNAEEKKTEIASIKLYLQTSMGMSNSKLFQRAVNDLVTFYSEIILDDKKFKDQEEFIYNLLNKLIKKSNNEELLLSLYNQLTGFLTKLAKDVISQILPEKMLDFFVKNLVYVKDILIKLLANENSSLHRDTKFIERLIEVWMFIILNRDYIFKNSLPLLKELAHATPRLIQYSATSYSNTFLIHPFLKTQKIIDKFKRHFKHIIRDDMKMIELRPKVRNLTLGEMVFIIALDFILDAKIEVIPTNPDCIIEYQKNIPFIEMIQCYIRDNYITERENLKEVLEELVNRKCKIYISKLLQVQNEVLQTKLAERDFVMLLQSSCSINPIYMKSSQIFLKEYIKEFSRLIFQKLVISSLCEVLEFLAKKIQYQFDSVSSRLKISHYNLKIGLPTNLKNIHDIYLFMLACAHSLCLRGFIIDGSTLLKRTDEVFSTPHFKDMRHGVQIFKYLLWTLNNHITLRADAANRCAAYWYYDKPYLQKKIETFQNKHLEEGLKIISSIPPNTSAELNVDSKLIISYLNTILKDFKCYEEDHSELIGIKKKGFNITKIFEEITSNLINLYVLTIIQKDRNYKHHYTELIKDKFIAKMMDPEVTSALLSGEKSTKMYEIVKARLSSASSKVITNLQLIMHYVRINPNETAQILTRLFDLALTYPVKKVCKYIIKHVTRNIIISIPSEQVQNVFFVIKSALQKSIYKFNTYISIFLITKQEATQSLMDINSEIFQRIKYKEINDNTDASLYLKHKMARHFTTFSDKEIFNIKPILNFVTIRHFKEIFSSIHKDFMNFITRNISTLLATHINPIDIMMLLSENNGIIKNYMEELNNDNIFTIIIAHLDIITVLKAQNFNPIEKLCLQKFYYNTLKFALSFFSKNTKFYIDGSYESKSCLKQIEKKMELGMKACRYLRAETFMETMTATEIKNPFRLPKITFAIQASKEGPKLLYTFHERRSKWFYSRIVTNEIGLALNMAEPKNISVIYDPSLEKKILYQNPVNFNRYQNLRKLLLNLIAFEVDTIKAFYKTEYVGNIRYDFTLEEKSFSENEIKPLIFSAFDINITLVIYILRRMNFALPINLVNSAFNVVKELINRYFLFGFQYQIMFDYFVEKNLDNPRNLRNIFYWDTPSFPLLMKYVTIEYQNYKLLQIYFTKTMKRLDSEQLTYYLPQIYQILNTTSNYIVVQTLKDYSKKSFLFNHQLIWKAKVETKREKGENTNTPLPVLSRILLRQLIKGMTTKEKQIFKKVDDFFEAITAISGVLKPKMPKPQKKEIIKEKLSSIPTNDYLYIPCNPHYRIVKIKLDSGTPMQSAAKCPILISFYCQKFEGPDKYYQKLLQKEEEKKAILEPDLDDEDIPHEDEAVINDLKESSNIKFFPKDRFFPMESERFSATAHPREIDNLQLYSEKNLHKIDEQDGQLEDEEKESPQGTDHKKYEFGARFDSGLFGSAKDEKKSNPLDLDRTPMNEIQSASRDDRFKHTKFSSLHLTAFDSNKQDSMFQDGEKNGKLEQEEDNNKLEVVSCIFKVFDDIRQDNLALQIIKLFKHIFQSVGLDLYLYPYTTISNRTGSSLDIGGIIEVVPNSISRDQMGKTNDYNLFEYFKARFGNETSPEFQLARDNFIKSMAAYSIVSYVLQIKDRHNGNILIDQYGHLIHIDFGFIFDISPAHNMKFESANFKLTKEMIDIMGGNYNAEPFCYYVDQTIKAFLAVRRYEEHIFNMIKLMTYSGLKCFRPMSLQNLKERFMPKVNDLQAANMMKKIINDAYNKLTTNLYDDIQLLQNKIHR